MTSLQSRILVSVIGVPVLLYVVLWASEWVMAVALAVLSGVAAYELMACVGAMGTSRGLCRLTVMSAVWAVLCTAYEETWLLPFLIAYVLLACAVAVRRAGEVTFAQLMAGVFAVTVIPYAFSSFLRIQTAGHRGFLLLPLIFSFASDTCAYFAGRALGRHKLAPRVSPNKTVEGAVGGLLGDAAARAIFALVMNTWFGRSIGYGLIAFFGLLCRLVAQLGDLTFSLIKREFGVKDYGKIFLAHGGVLDRFDSVIFVAPALAALVELLGG